MSPQDNEWMTAAIREEMAYEVITNSDTNEGRGRQITLGFCPTFAAAKTLAKGRGIMGREALIQETILFRVMFHDHQGDENDFYITDLVPISTEVDPEIKLREQALAKLTPEEAEALGYKK